jgi:hypothetical protein
LIKGIEAMPLLRGQRPKLIELRDVDKTTFSDEAPVVKKQAGEPMFGGAPPGGSETSAVSGTETITDLAVGAATEITVDHSADADFDTCEYPRIVGPVGVRATVLASGISGDSTTGAQFVLLVENVSYVADGGYGYSEPDITLDWTRVGQVAI